MAYLLQSTLAIRKGFNQRWEELDVSELTIGHLIDTYRDVLLTLTSPYLSGSHTLNLTEHRNLVPQVDITVSAWLAANGNTTLPTTAGFYQVDYRKAKYKDIYQAGYHVQRVHHTSNPDVLYPMSEYQDFLITKGGVDYDVLQKHSLISVNGFFHRTEATDSGLYVKRGSANCIIADENHLGILSTYNLGSLKYKPFTNAMIYKQHPEDSLRSKAYINLGENTDNKVVLLCVAGRLHVLDGFYKAIGNGQLVINTNKIDMMRLFNETRYKVDMSDLGALINYDPDHGVPVNALESEDAVIALLTHHLTFAIIVDTPNIVTARKDLEICSIPGTTFSPERPEDLLFFSSGKNAVYRTYEDWGKWVLNFPVSITKPYRYTTSEWLEEPHVNDDIDFSSRQYYEATHLLEIGKEVLVLG